jgi:hypothetical protein
MGPKTLPTIWGTYMKLVTKYQISAINSCWEKCDEKCPYMFNVHKNQLSQQTGSRNPTGPKTLPTIWYTYMTLVTKYQISAINSYWEKCDEKYLGRTDRQTDRGKTVYTPFGEWGYNKFYGCWNINVLIQRYHLFMFVSVFFLLYSSLFSKQGLPELEVNEFLFIHPKSQCLHIVYTIITAIPTWNFRIL